MSSRVSGRRVTVGYHFAAVPVGPSVCMVPGYCVHVVPLNRVSVASPRT